VVSSGAHVLKIDKFGSNVRGSYIHMPNIFRLYILFDIKFKTSLITKDKAPIEVTVRGMILPAKVYKAYYRALMAGDISEVKTDNKKNANSKREAQAFLDIIKVYNREKLNCRNRRF
jgi:hypothetical protein